MSSSSLDPPRFGTDGWRDVIADRFTFANVRRVAAALCRVLRAQGAPARLVVGYDLRFLSPEFAAAAAETAAAHGFEVFLTDEPTPTPAVAWATREMGAGAGVMITASHNPPRYNGFKIKGPFGGPALPAFTAAVEAEMARAAEGAPAGGCADAGASARGRVVRFNALPEYLAQVRRLVPLQNLSGAPGPWVVDPMHGAGRGVLHNLLSEAGLVAHEIRCARDPLFGGVNPEPVAANLGALAQAIHEHGAVGGLVTDGDADRVGAMDGAGRLIDSQRVFALLLRHLVEDRGWQGTVVKTFAVSDMVEQLAARWGLPVEVRPIGFKYVTDYVLEGGPFLLGGEESGGLGVQGHLPERDGLLCALLLVEMCAQRRKTPSELVDELLADLGPHVYQRLDLHLTEERKQALLADLQRRPPSQVAGCAVTAVDDLDGFKLRLGDHGWILFRASGTEPLVRVYAEYDSEEGLERVLAAGRAIAEGNVAAAQAGAPAT